MRRFLSFAAGCIFVLCSIPLAAQTSANFSLADKYKAAKAVLQQFYKKGELSSGLYGSEPGEYDLSGAGPPCVDSTEYLGSFQDDSKNEPVEKPQHKNDDIADFVLDAVKMVVWENDLRKLHIPEQIWRPVLDRYEASILDPKQNTINATAVTAQLNAAMARAGRSKPKFVFQPGCGSGGADVHFTLKPADGQLFLIPVFLYKLCQVQHLSPLDFKSCDRWKEIFTERVWAVSGDYMYLARWTDGVVRCGLLTYDDFSKGFEKQNSMLVITKLRSPECSPAF
jgi:hypothetical protein